MELSKKELKQYISNKEYVKSINVLSRSIKSILTNKVKEKDKEFEYVNLLNLRNKCIELLDISDVLIIDEFYELQMEEFDLSYEVTTLMKLYNKLNK